MRPCHSVLLLLFVAGCGLEPVVPDKGPGKTTEPVVPNKGPGDTVGGTSPDPGEPYLYEPVIEESSWEEDEQSRKLSATATRGGFEYKIAFTETKFDEGAHVVELVDYRTHIDGRIAHGVDGGTIPRWEISKIEVQFDGEAVSVPEHLYSACYEFGMRRFADGSDTYIDGVILRILADGVLQVSALASDAAGTYLVHWWFGGNQPAVKRIAVSEAEMHAYDDNWKTEVPARQIARS